VKNGLFDIIGICEAGIQTLLPEYFVCLEVSDQFDMESRYTSFDILPYVNNLSDNDLVWLCVDDIFHLYEFEFKFFSNLAVRSEPKN
jgi:hypothetical protein